MSSEYHNGGNSEANEKQGLAALFAQSATPGVATTGVLYGLAVSQTTTASGSVQISQGAGVVQASFTDGASLLTNPDPTLDVLTANPVGSLGRNDIVVFDALTAKVSVVVGTPNAAPTDPTVPATSLKLARLRHAANATSIPTAKVDDLRVYTSLLQPSKSGWQDFTPRVYSNMVGSETPVAGTVVYARWRMADPHTVHAVAQVTFTNATTGGAGIDLPIPGVIRSADCGSAGLFGLGGAPTDQSGIGFMNAAMNKLIITAYSTGFRDAAAGNTLRYSVFYEV